MPVLTKDVLERLTRTIFQRAGAPGELADRVAEVLVENNLAGHDSHGVLRSPEYIKSIRAGEIVPTACPAVISETDTTALPLLAPLQVVEPRHYVPKSNTEHRP